MAILVAGLAVPAALGQQARADLDNMPIFGLPADRVDRYGIGGPGKLVFNGPYLGIETRDIAEGRGGAREAHGVQVTQVEAGSPAAKAGFKSGDIVLDYNGQAVESKAQLSRLVNETNAGVKVRIGVWRAGARFTLTPTLEAFQIPTTGTFGLQPGTVPPVLISKVDPELTPQARTAGIEGKVLLSVDIGTDGRVSHARVIEGLGYGLNDKAMEAVAQWRFNPGKKNGVPVITAVTIEVRFRRQ
jgi:TonB family protein